MTNSAHTLSLIHANGLQADALAANRSGILSDEQIQLIRLRRRSRGIALIVISLICIVGGGWGLIEGGSEPVEGGRFGAITVIVIGVVLMALRFSDFGSSFKKQLAAGRVSSIDGFIQIRHTSSNRDSGTQHSYYYMIDGREFETTEDGAKLIDSQMRYRIYYLPGSSIMLNIDSLGIS
jgi:hypothetical protein